jgi:hypothetical protein
LRGDKALCKIQCYFAFLSIKISRIHTTKTNHFSKYGIWCISYAKDGANWAEIWAKKKSIRSTNKSQTNISIKSSLIDRWSIGWSDRKMSAICPTLAMTFLHKDVKMGLPQIRYFIIKESFHLQVKIIKSYLNDRKCKIFGFWCQRKILKNWISITNRKISTKLSPKLLNMLFNPTNYL